MSIFGKKTESNLENKEFPYIMPTTESFDQILTDSAKESYQLRAGMYISDIIMEEAVFEGASTAEVLMEGFANNAWTKVKEIFQKLKEKLIALYAKFRRAVTLIFSSGKTFITNFEEEIMRKSVKGFEYKGFKYTLSNGDSAVSKATGAAQSALSTYAGGLEEAASKLSSAQYERLQSGSFKEEYDVNEEKEELLKKAGGDSLNELREDIVKAYRNNETEPEAFEGFNGNNRNDMINWIKGKDKAIKAIDDAEKVTSQSISKAIKAIETAANKFKGESYGKIAPYVSFSTEMMRFCVTIISSAAQVKISIVKAGAREFESVLKAFLRYKPAKESFGSTDLDQEKSVSILEAAMNSL